MFAKKMLDKHPLSARLLLFALLPLALALLWLWSYLRTSLPMTEGAHQLSAIRAEVKLNYDEHGMVHIEAKNDLDGYFALGFAHASDRLWQLEMQRRIATGTLSEVLGQNTLAQDVWLRTLGLELAAQEAWQALSVDAKAALSAYTQGINSRIEQLEVLPSEFLLLGVEPQPWQEVESLAWMKVFALNLAGNMWSELNNTVAKQWLDDAQSASLIKGYPADGVRTITAESSIAADALFALKDQLEQLDIGGRFVGSNAWVVAPEHSANGQAILANDPHLGLQMPSLWYAAAIKGDKLDVSGMTLVGLPMVIFGRNQQISWGGTNMMADAQDLKVEQVDTAAPNYYQVGDKLLPFSEEHQEIVVKAESPASLRVPLAPVKLTVRKTLNGPVISDVIEGFNQPMSLRWSALDNDDTSFEAFYRLGYAQDWQQFRQALAYHVAPALNMLYADKQNNIGYQGAGRIPQRFAGEGMLPVSDSAHAKLWQGYVPFAQMPSSFNPPKGYLVSANNKVVDDSYPHFISNEWAEPARAQRITALLEQKFAKGEKVDLAYNAKMQLDQMDLSLLALRDHLLSSKDLIALEQQHLIDFIADWDGQVSAQSAPAALLQVWSKHLKNTLYLGNIAKPYGQKAQFNALKRLVANASNAQVITALQNAQLWCGDSQSQSLPSCKSVLNDSLALALEELELFIGDDPQDWAWGDLHQANFSHLPFSQVNLVDRFFVRKFHTGGSANAINVSNARYVELEGYEMSFGAGFRQLISQGHSELTHQYVNSTGQSGNPLSPHYDDAIEAYVQGQLFSAQPSGSFAATVTLTPKAQ